MYLFVYYDELGTNKKNEVSYDRFLLNLNPIGQLQTINEISTRTFSLPDIRVIDAYIF